MARTASDIRQALIITLAGINETLDMKVGPTFDFLLAPLPPELAAIEAEIERLFSFYSSEFPNVATDEEIRQFANNFNLSPDTGGFAKVNIIFSRSSAPIPGQDLVIPVGTLVATRDGQLMFRVTTPVRMIGDFAATFYNAATNRYEIETSTVALAPGTVYNVPPGRINRLITTMDGIDSVEQRLQAAGGEEPGVSADLAKDVLEKFKGLDTKSIGGIQNIAKRINQSAVAETSVVRPTDRREFRRFTSGPALDLYVSGEEGIQFTEEFIALGGETVVPFIENRTVTSIDSVAKNGTVLLSSEWAFVPDSTPETRLSTRASPLIQLATLLFANDVIEIIGTRNALLDQLQVVFLPGGNSIFMTDILVRSFIELPVIIIIEVKLSSPDVLSDPQGIIENVIRGVIERIPRPDLLVAKHIEDTIKTTVPSVEYIRTSEFRRKFGSRGRVETIIPLKNEIPVYSSVGSKIVVRT